jgi:hypothetical protein
MTPCYYNLVQFTLGLLVQAYQQVRTADGVVTGYFDLQGNPLAVPPVVEYHTVQTNLDPKTLPASLPSTVPTAPGTTPVLINSYILVFDPNLSQKGFQQIDPGGKLIGYFDLKGNAIPLPTTGFDSSYQILDANPPPPPWAASVEGGATPTVVKTI